MSLEQYNRAKENQVYRHELELEMQRRRRYLEMCKLMEEYNQKYYHSHHLPRNINEWLHEKTHDLGEYVK